MVPLPKRAQAAAFGALSTGEAVQVFTLRNAAGVTARLLDYGATLLSLSTPDKHGDVAVSGRRGTGRVACARPYTSRAGVDTESNRY